MEKEKLIARLNRAQGQIEAIKKIIQNSDTPDCLQTMYQLKAASNALKKFGEAYVNDYFTQCMSEKSNTENKAEMAEQMKDIIKSAFTL